MDSYPSPFDGAFSPVVLSPAAGCLGPCLANGLVRKYGRFVTPFTEILADERSITVGTRLRLSAGGIFFQSQQMETTI